jgi:hypothetical protein
MPLDYEALILEDLVANLDGWGQSLRENKPSDSWARMFHSDNPAQQLRDWGCRYDSESFAFGHDVTAADRMGFTRAARNLAGLHLVVVIRRRGSRVSHLQITPKGLDMGVRLVRSQGGKPDLGNLALALATSRWATSEHLAAVEALKEAAV